jgi:hypothetical protein
MSCALFQTSWPPSAIAPPHYNNTMSVQTKEASIILAIEAICTTQKLSCRRTAAIYNVPEATLRARMTGVTPRACSGSPRLNLTTIEEEVIVQYVLDRDSRGFSSRIADVGDMANLLIRKRDTRPVGKNWPARFITRRPELKTRFNRVTTIREASAKILQFLKRGSDWLPICGRNTASRTPTSTTSTRRAL